MYLQFPVTVFQTVYDSCTLVSVCLYLEEKPLEGRTGIRDYVFDCDMGQTMEQQQRESSN